MKNIVIGLFSLIAVFSSCKKEDIYPQVCVNEETSGNWLEDKIKDYKRGDQKVEIHQATYQGQNVFMVNDCVGCADAMTNVYDCYGEVICQFGGIAGLNTCPDFDDTAIDIKLVYTTEK